MEEETITLDSKKILELEVIITDNDKDKALMFLKEYIWRPIKKRKEHPC